LRGYSVERHHCSAFVSLWHFIIKVDCIVYALIEEINRKLPEAHQRSNAWRYPGSESSIGMPPVLS
jgi:hypothetical protein